MATSWKNINHKFSKERHAEVKQEAKAELKRIGFDKLRLARQQTQVALAERLDVPQNAVSRLERRTDLLLSTLRGYVEGLGGGWNCAPSSPTESSSSNPSTRPAAASNLRGDHPGPGQAQVRGLATCQTGVEAHADHQHNHVIR